MGIAIDSSTPGGKKMVSSAQGNTRPRKQVVAKSQNVSENNGLAARIEANKYRTQADGNNDLKAREEAEVKRQMAQASNVPPFQDFNHGNVM